VFVAIGGPSPVAAAEAAVGLGTATSFAVLGGSTVTNTGPSVISGDVGLHPGTSVTGFPPGIVNDGSIHATDALASSAKDDLVTAYNDAAGRSMTGAVTADLGGQTLLPGVYRGPTLGLTGALTLDGAGDPNAVFIFQASSTLTTATASSVVLIGSAQACNVFWQVGSSATLGTASDFAGTIMALTSISATTGATIEGQLLARNGAVTLDTNTITRPVCDTTQITTTSTTTGGSTTSTTTGGSTTSTTTGGSTTSTSAVVVPPTVPGGGTTSSTVPGGGTTSSTVPGGGTTSSTVPGGGTTSSTVPGGGTTSSTRPIGPGRDVPGATGGKLPTTGSSPLGAARVAFVLLIVGGGVLVASRRYGR